MDKLYQKIIIEDYESIRLELLKLITEEQLNSQTNTSWTIRSSTAIDKCPTLKNFLKNRCKKPVTLVKFYISPPGLGTGYHVDGTERRQPFGLTLPLMNTENTYFNWYKEDPTNFVRREFRIAPLPENFMSPLSETYIPIDISKLELLDSLEITQPTFTRTDLMHSVTNNTDKIRGVVVLRWLSPYQDFQSIDDVIDVSDIII
jgi:hypothetical protein